MRIENWSDSSISSTIGKRHERAMFHGMSLSRRQFFRRLLNPADKSNPRRTARYEELKTYVRTCLLPYDFSLTEWETAELLGEVQMALEAASDEDLFCDAIRVRIDKLVEAKVEFWRQVVVGWAKEIRSMAIDHVTTFLAEAEPEDLDRLKQFVSADDPEAFELQLRTRVEDWLNTLEDDKLLQYDVMAVKELVYAELRSWC